MEDGISYFYSVRQYQAIKYCIIQNMSKFDFCGLNCNQHKSEKRVESQITPRDAFEQFSKHRFNKKHPSNNVSNELTESR